MHSDVMEPESAVISIRKRSQTSYTLSKKAISLQKVSFYTIKLVRYHSVRHTVTVYVTKNLRSKQSINLQTEVLCAKSDITRHG